jgi:uncharacterized membrane protein (DUF2068 family)
VDEVLTRQTNIVRGVRTVAMFEGLKGTLVFIAGFGLLSLVHQDVQAVAEQLVQHLHLNPARHYPRVFIEAAGNINDTDLRSLAALACVYGVVRFIEAYGLWQKKVWAAWFAIISGSIYLPVEAYEIFERVTWMTVIVFLVNAFIVGYLVYVRLLTRAGRIEVDPSPSKR